MESFSEHSEQDLPGYTSGDLEWLQLQYRLRHTVAAVNAQSAQKREKTTEDQPEVTGSLAALFGSSALTPVITEAEKLRRVRARRERYLETRNVEDFVDFLLKVRTTETTFAHLRLVESKGVSYWYRRTEEDYKENWFLSYTPVRRYYEELSDRAPGETNVDKLGQRMLAVAGPVEFSRERRRRRNEA